MVAVSWLAALAESSQGSAAGPRAAPVSGMGPTKVGAQAAQKGERSFSLQELTSALKCAGIM